ncbi:MAG: HXXEE domain-containing protein [Acidobacteriota bacterium]
MDDRNTFPSWGRAWTLLCLALAIHVADEALTDFLGFWNPAVTAIRESVPWIPLPTFRFGTWLALLLAAVGALLALGRYPFRGAVWMRPLSIAFALMMVANGLGHLAISIYLGRLAPGVYSSPLLLLAAIHLWRSLPDRGS